MQNHLEPIIRLRSDLAWQVVDGEVVVLDPAASAYLGVNDTGAVLWPLVASGATQTELAGVLEDRFMVGTEQACSDVSAFVARLRTLALIEEE